MKHKIYVAAPAEYWDKAQIFADAFTIELGDVTIVSRWHARPVAKYPTDADERARETERNVAGLEQATVVVALCDSGSPRTTFADIGYALGRGVPVIWVKGQHESQQCMFDAHRLVRPVEPAINGVRLATLDLITQIARIIERELDTEAA